ncbi:universal stress protein [Nitrosomonas sp. Nm166]|uniref:universal stress protein n=1 Tax=Nitrosomonas sp. Nm166 TaxID=1881054 RepID=UPI0008E0A0FD|nr:universal stress protein [Nitrosomonas sp. Nm166]SFE37204.1 Nucleotide-binding universal stress protein, UspA family [Nitrosomonas sp. Nm166]
MKQFSNILCAVSAGESSRPTLERAISLSENNQAQLTVVGVIPRVTGGLIMTDGTAISADLQAAMITECLQVLQCFTEPYQQRLYIQHEVLIGTGFLEIIRTVLRNGHDLLIKPAENPNFVDRLFGSDDMHLLRKCPCPVWLTQPAEKSNYKCILAAIDFDPESPDATEQDLNQQILDLSSSLALSDFAALHFVHVWDAPGEATVRSWSNNANEAAISYVEGERLRHERGLDRLHEQLKNYLGKEAYEYLSPQFHLCRGTASMVIPATARQFQADMVVMGTVARTGIAGLLIGNTAETILEQLRCSVLAIKPAGFISPVKLAE